MVCFFSVGLYSVRSDTEYFVDQIKISRGGMSLDDLSGATKDLVYFRLFKPVYGALSVFPFGNTSPNNVILILNLIFFIGLTISSYYYFEHVGFDKDFAFLGSVWVSSGYPVLKYGLALVTDISGWFFAVFSMAIFLYAIKINRLSYIAFASIVGFVGSLSKETGVLGLMFCGLYLLINNRFENKKEVVKKMIALCLPFFLLQGLFLFLMKNVEGPSLFGWVKYNYNIYFYDFYKIRYFITNEFLSFNLIWIFVFIGMFYLIRERFWGDNKKMSIFIASLFPAIVVFAWPVFYYRILFIQFIFLIPIALYGVKVLTDKYAGKFHTLVGFFIFYSPVVISILLYIIIKKY
jgi:hypothetical protein